MKKNIYLIVSMLLLITLTVKAQSDDVSIEVTGVASMQVNLTDSVGVTFCNNSWSNPYGGAYVQIALDDRYFNFTGLTQDKLPTGWSVVRLTNNDATILLSMGSDQVPASQCRDFKVKFNSESDPVVANLFVANIIFPVGAPNGDVGDNNGSKASITTTLPTGIQLSEQTSSIYPNPANDYVFIEASVAQTATLYEAQGQVRKVVQLQAGKNKVDIAGLSAGVYIVKIGNKNVKLVKQ